ncbi:hypothetical protein SAMN05445756_1686 [Kytococcus aerolatus]|uniref:Uncharacterized protein n=1 Tax=Kytococcus aerolatus TaxID=592308 RepID=A0A212U172_9MICO|nr:hypothetical protein [Kytococcus aerolatus]SNC71992.1 hypothetical protein SAMN05445756_1686 [Kytococcus aerolatus]
MPTTRPRHLVTESDELAAALDRAHEQWPELSRSRLVVRLALEGEQHLQQQRGAEAARRRALLAAAGERFAGVGSSGAVREARDGDWPA